MPLAEYKCPKCDATTTQPSGVEVTHPCPAMNPYKKRVVMEEQKGEE